MPIPTVTTDMPSTISQAKAPANLPKKLESVLLDMALKLNAQPPSAKQYQILLQGLQQVVNFDAAGLFIYEKNSPSSSQLTSQPAKDKKVLRPLATKGLAMEVMGRTFDPTQHPRLAAILDSAHAVQFASDSKLADPFDGLLALSDQPSLGDHREIDVHACMGCSLRIEGEIIGVLTIDAADPDAFLQLKPQTLETFAAFAAATIRNISLFEALKFAHQKQKNWTKTLIEQTRSKFSTLIGQTPVMQALKSNIKMVAPSQYAVLISGETGTGKELVAQSIYQQSLRSDKPMVYVNCAALPESIAESELFGHVKGAFTGANSHRSGKFELADGGTIFLDEIGELPLLLQAKLLRVIQQGELQRVGSDQNKHIDVRIIAATNRDLEQEVSAGRFRSDLYHRLNVFPIYVAPLRERLADIPLLAGHILDKLKPQLGISDLYVKAAALTQMQHQTWPGNVRELEHSLMRAALRAIGEQSQGIDIKHFQADFISRVENTQNSVSHSNHQQDLDSSSTSSQTNSEAAQSLDFCLEDKSIREAVECFQKQLIEDALRKSGGVWSQAAKALKMDRGNLYKMGKKLGVQSV